LPNASCRSVDGAVRTRRQNDTVFADTTSAAFGARPSRCRMPATWSSWWCDTTTWRISFAGLMAKIASMIASARSS
jgi:hypothetical protein